MLKRKYRKNAHIFGVEAWHCPEAGRTFRARKEETEALRRGQGKERGASIRMRCCGIAWVADRIGGIGDKEGLELIVSDRRFVAPVLKVRADGGLSMLDLSPRDLRAVLASLVSI